MYIGPLVQLFKPKHDPRLVVRAARVPGHGASSLSLSLSLLAINKRLNRVLLLHVGFMFTVESMEIVLLLQVENRGNCYRGKKEKAKRKHITLFLLRRAKASKNAQIFKQSQKIRIADYIHYVN